MDVLSNSQLWPKAVEVLAPAARTATATSAAIDLAAYKGGVALTLHSAAGTGTAPTMDGKVQDCATSGGTYADVAGATFTQVTDAAGGSIQRLIVDTRKVKEFIKVVLTIAGTTPSFTCAVSLAAIEEYPA